MARTQVAAGFALGTFSDKTRPPFPGLVLEGDRVVAIDALYPLCEELGEPLPRSESTLAMIEQWSGSLPALQRAAQAIYGLETPTARTAADSLVNMDLLQTHPPVASRQIFMSGANYFKHVVDLIVDQGPGKNPGTEGMTPSQLRTYAEQLMTTRKREGSPYFFSKPVSVLSGAFDPIVIPDDALKPDWELELAVIIGAPARYVKREQAMNHVAGYTIANDISDRATIWTTGDMKAMGTDWMTSKCRPGWLPTGPYLVPASQVPSPQDLQLELRLNGEIKQDESTSDMIFDIARLIEHLSSVVQLLPGDLICTGSPAGNGTHYNRFLEPGDLVEASITGLGTQHTPVIAERS